MLLTPTIRVRTDYTTRHDKNAFFHAIRIVTDTDKLILN